MPWVVDTSVLLDIRIGHPREAAEHSAQCLKRHAKAGLIVCPVTMIEMAPAFGGNFDTQQRWLDNLGIASRIPWDKKDTEANGVKLSHL